MKTHRRLIASFLGSLSLCLGTASAQINPSSTPVPGQESPQSKNILQDQAKTVFFEMLSAFYEQGIPSHLVIPKSIQHQSPSNQEITAQDASVIQCGYEIDSVRIVGTPLGFTHLRATGRLKLLDLDNAQQGSVDSQWDALVIDLNTEHPKLASFCETSGLDLAWELIQPSLPKINNSHKTKQAKSSGN